MGTLRLLDELAVADRHDGEIFACAYAPDGTAVLSAGWDGHLRFWNVATGDLITSLKASAKPLSACAFTPDGKYWLSGSMEGLFAIWHPETRESLLNFVAHTRPVSSIVYAPDGKQLVSTSWDRQIALRKVNKEREGKMLGGHTDIVAGTQFTPDGKHLFSWSYDRSVRLWEVDPAREIQVLGEHEDRVTAAAVAPDGGLAVSASRDGTLKLWDLRERAELGAAKLTAEVRCVFFMLDGESIVTVDANGWVAVLAVPTFEMRMDLQTGVRPMCGDRAPSGEQFVLGCEDGTLRFVAVEGYECAPLVVTPSQTIENTTTFLDRLVGKTRMTTLYHYKCPVCRHAAQVTTLPNQPVVCPLCARPLRVMSHARQLQEK